MVEAAMILPIVILILAGTLVFLIRWEERLELQVDQHLEERAKKEWADADYVRNVDLAKDAAKSIS